MAVVTLLSMLSPPSSRCRSAAFDARCRLWLPLKHYTLVMLCKFHLRPPCTTEESKKPDIRRTRRYLGKARASWEAGGAPADLATISGKAPVKTKRDVFLYIISGAKVRAPAAAMALIERLSAAATTLWCR